LVKHKSKRAEKTLNRWKYFHNKLRMYLMKVTTVCKCI
jgi:hypothetical protein